jgi:hypothetical protein
MYSSVLFLSYATSLFVENKMWKKFIPKYLMKVCGFQNTTVTEANYLLLITKWWH